MINIGIIGVNGLVGKSILQSIELLELTNLANITNIEYHLIGSRSGKIKFNGLIYDIKVFEYGLLLKLNYVILAVDNLVSKNIIKYCYSNNLDIVIIDNSSQYRMELNIPLIIPEINIKELETEKFIETKTKLISNPNCVTTIVCMCLRPLLNLAKIQNLTISTYQAASGAGYKGLDELELQTKQYVNREPITKDFWNIQYVSNVFTHNTKIDLETGFNEEELKLINETKKILGKSFTDHCKSINPTCIRVPTIRSHCVSLCVEFDWELGKDDIIYELNKFNGIIVMDGLEPMDNPNPVFTSEKPEIYVGRIRHSINDKSIWNFFVSGDQLLKGAGYNSVQILKCLLEKLN